MSEINQACSIEGTLKLKNDGVESIYLRQVKYGEIGDDNRIISVVGKKKKEKRIDHRVVVISILSLILFVNIVLIILSFF